jgi:hypothetical protein
LIAITRHVSINLTAGNDESTVCGLVKPLDVVAAFALEHMLPYHLTIAVDLDEVDVAFLPLSGRLDLTHQDKRGFTGPDDLVGDRVFPAAEAPGPHDAPGEVSSGDLRCTGDHSMRIRSSVGDSGHKRSAVGESDHVDRLIV